MRTWAGRAGRRQMPACEAAKGQRACRCCRPVPHWQLPRSGAPPANRPPARGSMSGAPGGGGGGGNRREPSDKRFILNATSNVHHRGAHAIERIRRGKRSPRWTPARRIGRLGGDTIAEYLYLKRVASSNQVPTTCGSATRMHHDTRHPGTYNISTSARGNTAEASRMGCIQCPS